MATRPREDRATDGRARRGWLGRTGLGDRLALTLLIGVGLLAALVAGAVARQAFSDGTATVVQERVVQQGPAADAAPAPSMTQQQFLERNMQLPVADAAGAAPGLDDGAQQRLATFDERDYGPGTTGAEEVDTPCRRFAECNR